METFFSAFSVILPSLVQLESWEMSNFLFCAGTISAYSWLMQLIWVHISLRMDQLLPWYPGDYTCLFSSNLAEFLCLHDCHLPDIYEMMVCWKSTHFLWLLHLSLILWREFQLLVHYPWLYNNSSVYYYSDNYHLCYHFTLGQLGKLMTSSTLLKHGIMILIDIRKLRICRNSCLFQVSAWYGWAWKNHKLPQYVKMVCSWLNIQLHNHFGMYTLLVH